MELFGDLQIWPLDSDSKPDVWSVGLEYVLRIAEEEAESQLDATYRVLHHDLTLCRFQI